MIKIAASQLDVSTNDIQINLQTISDLVEKAAAQQVNLLIFPELVTLGYDLRVYNKCSSEEIMQIDEYLISLANKFNLSILLGTHKCRDNSLTNSQVIYLPSKGSRTVYEKHHLFPGEEPYFNAGSNDTQFEIGKITFRSKICYDLRFPECFRTYSDMPQVFVVSAAWPLARVSHWKSLLVARAIENQSYVVAANRIGCDNGILFGGTSMIINPQGVIVSEASHDQNEIITALIEREEIVKTRRDFTVLDHMKFRVYSLNE